MGKQPQVTIGILNWNEWHFTVDLIKSLNKIDYNNYNIIVLDNGSKDNSFRELRKLEKKGKITLLKSKKNIGFTGGNNYILNKVIKEGKSDYILLLNNDTIVNKDFLKEMVCFLEKNDSVGVVGPFIYSKERTINMDSSPGLFNFYIGGSKRYKKWKSFGIKIKSPLKVDYLSGCCWLIKKDVVKKTKGFNDKYFIYNEEVEWAYRIKKEDYLLFLIPTSKIFHIGQATTKKISGFKQYYQIRNIIWFERQYANTLQLVIFFMYLFGYKLPKNILLNFFDKNGKEKILMLLKGLRDGFFKDYNN